MNIIQNFLFLDFYELRFVLIHTPQLYLLKKINIVFEMQQYETKNLGTRQLAQKKLAKITYESGPVQKFFAHIQLLQWDGVYFF